MEECKKVLKKSVLVPSFVLLIVINIFLAVIVSYDPEFWLGMYAQRGPGITMIALIFGDWFIWIFLTYLFWISWENRSDISLYYKAEYFALLYPSLVIGPILVLIIALTIAL